MLNISQVGKFDSWIVGKLDGWKVGKFDVRRGEEPKKAQDAARPEALAKEPTPAADFIPKSEMHIPFDLEFFPGRSFGFSRGYPSYEAYSVSLDVVRGGYMMIVTSQPKAGATYTYYLNINKGIAEKKMRAWSASGETLLDYAALPNKKTLCGAVNTTELLYEMRDAAQRVRNEGYSEMTGVIKYLDHLINGIAADEFPGIAFIPREELSNGDLNDRFLGYLGDSYLPFFPGAKFETRVSNGGKNNEYSAKVYFDNVKGRFVVQTHDHYYESNSNGVGNWDYILDLKDLTIDYSASGRIWSKSDTIPLVSCKWPGALRKMLEHCNYAIPNAVPEFRTVVEYLTYIQRFKVCDVTEAKGLDAPATFELNQNYPNPFNPSTTISFSLPKAGDARIEISNALGQVVKTFELSGLKPATHQVTWDAVGQPSGVYFYTLKAGEFSQTRQMVLMK